MILTSLVSLSLIGQVFSEGPNKLVCYYEGSSMGLSDARRFTPELINPYLCTHLIYGYAKTTINHGVIPDAPDIDLHQKGFERVVQLKKKNPKLKVLLSMGGPRADGRIMCRTAGVADYRKAFVASAIKFLRQYGFDGLDFNWQYPTFRGGHEGDLKTYPIILREIREGFEKEARKTGKERMLLTLMLPQIIGLIEAGFDFLAMSKHVDFMNLYTFDFHIGTEPRTYHHAPLYPLPQYNQTSKENLDSIIRYYIDNGLESTKLVMGIPAYGRTYTLQNPDNGGLLALSDGEGTEDIGSTVRGLMPYREICRDQIDDNEQGEWQITKRNFAMGPYASKGKLWVSYDDPETVKSKVRYARGLELGGVMFFAVNHMDSEGDCGQGSYPLLHAAKEVLKLDSTQPKTSTQLPLENRFQPTSNSISDQDIEDDLLVEHTYKHMTTPSRPISTTVRSSMYDPDVVHEDVSTKRNIPSPLYPSFNTLKRESGNTAAELSADLPEDHQYEASDVVVSRTTGLGIKTLEEPAKVAVHSNRDVIFQDFKVWIYNCYHDKKKCFDFLS